MVKKAVKILNIDYFDENLRIQVFLDQIDLFSGYFFPSQSFVGYKTYKMILHKHHDISFYFCYINKISVCFYYEKNNMSIKI